MDNLHYMNFIESRIRIAMAESTYDHRPFLSPTEAHPEVRERELSDDYMKRYARFKWAVSKVLQPDTILEIGVRGGVSALAFLDASPDAFFAGIDNNRDGSLDGVDYLSNVYKHMLELNRRWKIFIQDSQEMYELPYAALCHIDGCHSRQCTYHDVLLALKAKCKWILVDDADSDSVKLGIADALGDWRGTLHSFIATSFPETYGCSQLIYNCDKS